MTNIILCGGSGTRLWPLSRSLYPKQFVKIFDEHSLFQLTVERNKKLCENTIVVTNEKLQFMASDQIAEIDSLDGGKYSFLLEPVGRNTAPAIAIACLSLPEDELVFVSPSDHMILEQDEYVSRVKEAMKAAEKKMLVTFGITPSYPETGYGYIESDSATNVGDRSFTVKSFREKPDSETAQKYCDAGTYFWNSGMFVFTAGMFLEELKQYSPDIYTASVKAWNARIERDIEGCASHFIKTKEMEAIPADSIDYAVMEQSRHVAVVESNFGWNDLGSFDALYEVMPKNSDGNTVADKVVSVDSKNNILISANRKIAAVDIEDSIIIDTEDALLVSKRGSSQKVKDVVSRLKESTKDDNELTKLHTTVHRPWGTYTVLEESANFKMKRIVVKPGHRLSLQKHQHRSEHWVVVSGTATVQKDDKEELVSRNESTYISIGQKHRLTNDGKIPVVIIEVQVGEYLEEDDIERFDDDYMRVE